MSIINRRSFLEMAIALGATAAWGHPFPSASTTKWRERRDLYPEGVASGDPESESVLLWTRRVPVSGESAATQVLTAEISEDESFRHVVATAHAPISQASDWTCRVLVGGLKPAHVYWYRFTDSEGNGSRVGRTITAPANDDDRAVHFAFVSCQNANQGAQNAYRRMIFEDERAAEKTGWVSCCTSAISSTKSSGIRKTGRKACTTAAYATLCVTSTARKSTTFISRRRWTITARSIAPTCTIPICRMRAPAGLSCACGTTTNSAGWAGRHCRNSTV